MEKNNQLAEVKRDIAAQVLDRIELFKSTGELLLPEDYSAENALKSAMLILSETTTRDNKPVLEVCTKPSIANSLLKMVIWGLSPLKKQCDFIAYGNKLQCDPEYTGNIILAKRYGHLKEIKANAIFDGDTFEFGVDANTGHKKIIKHEQTLESIGSKTLKGAYAIYTLDDGTTDVEIMNMIQIKDAWNQGPMKGNSPAHKNFPDQMACKTVINRACKLLIRASDDSVLYNSEGEESNPRTAELNEKANKREISIEEAEAVEEVIESPQKEAAETRKPPVDELQKVTVESIEKGKEMLINDLGVMEMALPDENAIHEVAKEHGIEFVIEKKGPGF